ncbi:Hypothetical_protein [Hexamita inflata]|uniref:Hypothetical_protein n=1 Tax=Hexamita inflata TaxID=28002 RepID=A0AA86Q8B8_9EUKA|nr:Hypothetical protein HINF_LOCUS35707 [Hexamita inflata]
MQYLLEQYIFPLGYALAILGDMINNFITASTYMTASAKASIVFVGLFEFLLLAVFAWLVVLGPNKYNVSTCAVSEALIVICKLAYSNQVNSGAFSNVFGIIIHVIIAYSVGLHAYKKSKPEKEVI